MMRNISFAINGKAVSLEIAPQWTLLKIIREELRLTGTKEGCGEGECGSCTVLVNGKAVNCCLVLGVDVDGKSVTTIEGLAQDGELHPLQRAFVDKGAIQCGFCTPGMLLTAKALLDRHTCPTEESIRQDMAGNLCRCTGYVKILDAILHVVKQRSRET